MKLEALCFFFSCLTNTEGLTIHDLMNYTETKRERKNSKIFLNNHRYVWLEKGGIGEGVKISDGRGSQ